MIISLIITKILAKLKGTALPGLIGLKLTPTLINQIINKNNLYSIIITGTNGKTSTAKLLGAVLTDNKVEFIHNQSGSNLLRGIATTLINQSNIFGKIKQKYAIWEVDEATVLEAIKVIKPKVIVITNLSRDQLDRYGEIDHLVFLWQAGFKHLIKDSVVLVNKADPRLKPLRHKQLNYFGSDKSGLGLIYPARFSGKFTLDSIWAVQAVINHLGLDSKKVESIACKTPAAFGRGEQLKYMNKNFQINLVKNPASLKAVWSMILSRRDLNQPLLIILNDRLADGTDVSWIYDADFTNLSRRTKPVIASGSRALEMGLRLKYAGLKPNLIRITPKINQAVNQLVKLPGSTYYLLPTYTALLALRKVLKLPRWK